MKHYPRKPNDRLEELACKYEKMVGSDQVIPLKKSEFLLLTDYFEFEKFPQKALEVIENGIAAFQNSTQLQIRKIKLLLYNFKIQNALESLDLTSLKTSQLNLLQLEITIFQGDFQKALNFAKKLKSQYKKNKSVLSEILYLESIIYEKLGEHALSFNALTEVLWLNPAHQDAKGKIWMTTELSKKYEESIILNEFLLKHEHYSAITWFNLGHAFYSKGFYKKAIEAFEFCVIINENFESGFLDLAEVCLLIGLYQKAAKNLEYVIDNFNLNEIEIFIQYGEALMRSGEIRKARKAFLEGKDIDPLDPDLLFLLGETYRLENNLESAIAHYLEALEFDPLYDEIHKNLARVYFLKAEFMKAETHFEQAIEINPFQWEYRTALASYYLNIGEIEECERVLSIAVEEVPEPQLKYHYAAILMKMGNEEKALELLNSVLQNDFDKFEEVYEFAPELVGNKKIEAIISYYQGEQ